jgi:plastocyanin
MGLRRIVTVTALAGTLGLASAGCGWLGAGDSTHGPDVVATASAGPGGSQVVRIKGDEQMRFAPNVIMAHPGRLRIELTVTGATPHNLEVPKLHASTGMVEEGKSASVEVDLPSKGRYDFVCTYHEKHGMTGVIEVS